MIKWFGLHILRVKQLKPFTVWIFLSEYDLKMNETTEMCQDRKCIQRSSISNQGVTHEGCTLQCANQHYNAATPLINISEPIFHPMLRQLMIKFTAVQLLH